MSWLNVTRIGCFSHTFCTPFDQSYQWCASVCNPLPASLRKSTTFPEGYFQVFLLSRIEEADNEQGKLQHQIKRKETQIQNLEQRYDGAFSKQYFLNFVHLYISLC